jgi:hypothetical protein
VSNAPVQAIIAHRQRWRSPWPLAAQAPAPVAPSGPTIPSTPSAKVDILDKSVSPATKRKVEAGLTAAIATIIVQASRDQYHAGGRSGRACAGRSAYSRPGGAAPLCYPSDVLAYGPNLLR